MANMVQMAVKDEIDLLCKESNLEKCDVETLDAFCEGEEEEGSGGYESISDENEASQLQTRNRRGTKLYLPSSKPPGFRRKRAVTGET